MSDDFLRRIIRQSPHQPSATPEVLLYRYFAKGADSGIWEGCASAALDPAGSVINDPRARGLSNYPVIPLETGLFHIAGLPLRLTNASMALKRLDAVYAELDRRLGSYAANPANTVLCRAGCSHCCRSGGFFALTLVEAVRLNRAVAQLPTDRRDAALSAAQAMLERQQAIFLSVLGPVDQPGGRDEALFSARVSAVTRSRAACPLLGDEMCSIYAGRPFLCRAYGYAVDAYALESENSLVFRSLCVLYEGLQLTDYVRAKELRAALTAISRDLSAGRDLGRFTLPEAILASSTLGSG